MQANGRYQPGTKSRFFLRQLWPILFGLTIIGAVVIARAAIGDLFRVSVRSNGDQANNVSFNPAISGNGRYVAFASRANNLVDGDTNAVMDIFVYDRQTGQTTRVSRASDGGEANFESFRPAISADGRYVAFCSYATNLTANDANNVPDAFLHDRQTGTTTLVSRSVFNRPGNDISCKPHSDITRHIGPAISADGRYVFFESFASDLIGNDNNSKSDIFRYDHVTGAIIRVSEDSNGFEANGNSSYPAISTDGFIVAFQSDASNLVTGDGNGYTDVFVRDLSNGQTRRVSIHSNGSEGNGDSFETAVSANGQFVAFASFASNLVDGDSNLYLDVFLHNRSNGQTERVSLAANGAQVNTFADRARASLSADGRFVAFQSRATTLLPGDTDDTTWDIFVRDRQQSTIIRASISTGGGAGNLPSTEPVISADGFFVAFTSRASNLIVGDTNNVEDIYVYQLQEEAPPPPPPPPPPPTLSVNHLAGAPGSYFHFTGNDFQPQDAVFVYVNGRLVGDVQANADGNLSFSIRSFLASQIGAYSVAAYDSRGIGRAVFYLNAALPTRPLIGSGPTFPLPVDSALTEHVYLPVAHKP